MYKLKFISSEQFKEAKSVPIIITNNNNLDGLMHVKESIRIFLENFLGKKNLYTNGYRIKTTINKKLQILANNTFEKYCKHLRLSLNKNLNGGLLCMENKTGAIKAVVGGIDFNESQFNRAFLAKRQMGSIFKPIIYAAALQKNIKFTDTLIDEPTVFEFNNKSYAPCNFNNKFNGQMSLAQALSSSNNIIAVKTLLKVGIDDVVQLAPKFGIDVGSNKYPSLALGCIDTTLLHSMAMFSVFANNGIYRKPYFISWIKDGFSNKIYKNKQESYVALDSFISDQVAKVLTIGMRKLQKIYSNWISSESIGKTGTTNDARTCWFTGATPFLPQRYILVVMTIAL